jgi:Rho GTPase-activating protein 1
VPIDDLLEREKDTVPMIVKECISFLDSTGLKSEGIFRVSPNIVQMKELMVPLDQGKIIPNHNSGRKETRIWNDRNSYGG